jgi:hypothetical protein
MIKDGVLLKVPNRKGVRIRRNEIEELLAALKERQGMRHSTTK